MARWQTADAKERYLNSRYFQALCDFERKLIRDAMETSDGDINAAAVLLEVDEEMLKQRITRLGGVLDGQPIAKQFTGRWVPRTPPTKTANPNTRSDVESKRSKKRKAAIVPNDQSVGTASATSNEDVDTAPTGSDDA